MEQLSSSKVRDTVFRHLFTEPGHSKRVVELCNAVGGTSYPLDAQVDFSKENETGIYRRYSDISVTIEDEMFFINEHQSAINANMPLRALTYFFNEIAHYSNNKKLYSTRLIELPTPQFHVLYNGKNYWKDGVLRLSDSYKVKGVKPSLEILVYVHNIKGGEAILEKSETLAGYSTLIALWEKYLKETGNLDAAISMAIKECIRLGILKEYLETNYKEVAEMMNWQYNHEEELEVIKQEAEERGLEQGLERGAEQKAIETALKMLSKGVDVFDISDFVGLPVERIEELSRKS